MDAIWYVIIFAVFTAIMALLVGILIGLSQGRRNLANDIAKITNVGFRVSGAHGSNLTVSYRDEDNKLVWGGTTLAEALEATKMYNDYWKAINKTRDMHVVNINCFEVMNNCMRKVVKKEKMIQKKVNTAA